MTPRRALRPLALLVLAGLLVACNSSTGPTAAPPTAAPTTIPGGSTAACPTAPSAPSNLAGWTSTAAPGGLIPQVISSQLVCGQNRLLFGFTQQTTDSTGQPQLVSVGSPTIAAKVAFYDLAKDPKQATMTTDATFQWAIEGKTGIYVAPVTFSEAGDWGAEFTAMPQGQPTQTIRVRFQVQDVGLMPAIGATVPSVKTPTLSDPGVNNDPKKIATDPTPDPRLYQVSEDQAVAQHKPFVLVFATPAFCQSQVCGPTLDKIKAVIGDYPGMTFINVEPYKMQFTDGHLQPVLSADGQLQVNDASAAFNLLSEPWIYVVNGQGKVTGSFETLAGPDELKTAIDAALKG
jgi:hypothetical protein